MKLALQHASRNLRAEPAYPNASTCVQCASVDSPSNTFRALAKASPVPSYSYRLFVVSKEAKSFAIKQIQTLSQKHRVGGHHGYRYADAKPHGNNPFIINTCKSVSKQRTLTTFRMNTYAKQGEGGVLLLTKIPKGFCPERLGGAQGSLPPLSPDGSHGARNTRHGSRPREACTG
jgi:hypothetical protein